MIKDPRWGANKDKTAGSPSGLRRLPNPERKDLYAFLIDFVDPNWASGMRDWRPSKIIEFLESEVWK